MEPIAIIGMACRFPGARDCDALWELLRDGRDAITEVPRDRWDIDACYAPPPAIPGKMTTRWGGFLEEIDLFDADFFAITRHEATFLDPQQRLVLEVAWHALEDAAIAAPDVSGSNTGVFIGVSNFDYNRILCSRTSTMDAYSSTGTILAINANRLSYFLNLRGPSIAVDTACSSSLVAVHMACQSLANGDCNLALAGGVNAILTPEVTIILSQTGLMSADGRCKSFDASANGYVRSEGCGILVLKRLREARADGDRILAVIRGSAVNQDGATNGLMAPSASAQQALIRSAIAKAEIAPHDISCVEAHGSGTVLGDIIEWRSLRAVLLPGRGESDRCVIGSIKSNIGHAESAAGVAGLCKVVLSLRNETIAPTVHLANLNPHLRTAGTPFLVPTAPLPWPRQSEPRIAGISSFGIGGTNAHVIVEEAPEDVSASRDAVAPPYILPISSRTESGLSAMIAAYRSWIESRPDVAFDELCRTAARGRAHFEHRRAFVFDTRESLLEQLSNPQRSTAEHPYERNEEIAWNEIFGRSRPLAAAPSYVFQKQRYWWDDVEQVQESGAVGRQRLRSRTVSEVSP